MVTTPSVRDVLRMRGGFTERPDSYRDQSLIDASIYGEYPITGAMMYDYVVQGGRLGAGENDNYWNSIQYDNGTFVYSNPGFSMLGELVRVQSGLPYEDYVRTNILTPLNLHEGNPINPNKMFYPDPSHRNARNVPTKLGLRSYLINSKHPYISDGPGCTTVADCDYLQFTTCGPNGNCTGCSQNSDCEPGWICAAHECVDSIVPFTESEQVPKPLRKSDSSPRWAANAGAPSASSPDTAAVGRYGGKFDMGGAPLAAGGWHGDGEALGLLIRAIARFGFLMPASVAAQLWSPQWWAQDHGKGPGWSYGLAWYARGNWVTMAGGTDGGMATVAHNLEHDFTVVHLANLKGNGLVDLFHPLLLSQTGDWSTGPEGEQSKSIIGGQFPCKNDDMTPGDECQNLPSAAY
jgi:CubicO group peptidase (beta-lactamase class C family)